MGFSEDEKKEMGPQGDAVDNEKIAHAHSAQHASPEGLAGQSSDTSPEPTLFESVRNIDNIGRILDIKIEMRVQIGVLKVSLERIMSMHPGVVLEVEKNADSLLDLKIGEKTVARGEVVTVGENLGLRIRKK